MRDLFCLSVIVIAVGVSVRIISVRMCIGPLEVFPKLSFIILLLVFVLCLQFARAQTRSLLRIVPQRPTNTVNNFVYAFTSRMVEVAELCRRAAFRYFVIVYSLFCIIGNGITK